MQYSKDIENMICVAKGVSGRFVLRASRIVFPGSISEAIAAECVIPEQPIVSTSASSIIPSFTLRLSLQAPYVIALALDKNNEICGYKFVSLGKMTDFIKKGLTPNEAYEKAIARIAVFIASQTRSVLRASRIVFPGSISEAIAAECVIPPLSGWHDVRHEIKGRKIS